MPLSDTEAVDQPRVMYVVRSWPRLSQTFIVQEILALEQRGVDIQIVSLTRSGETLIQPDTERVRASVRVLDDDLKAASRRLAVALRCVTTQPRATWHAIRSWRWDRGYHASSRFRCLLHAFQLTQMVAAARVQNRSIDHVHAHFAHDPAAVVQLAARMRPLQWSFTAHARDLYQLDPSTIRERVASATSVVTICNANVAHLASLLPPSEASKLSLIHNGLDFDQFPAQQRAVCGGPLRVVSIARLVEKKGLADLLQACRVLCDTGLSYTLTVFGDGPLSTSLQALSTELALDEVVTFAGARPRPELIDELYRSDVFALTPCVTLDGDRDGIPTVLVEAMACGLPVVTTDVAGITDLVQHEVSGFVLDPHDVESIADALLRLAADSALRCRMGNAAREIVEREFNGQETADMLLRLFDLQVVDVVAGLQP